MPNAPATPEKAPRTMSSKLLTMKFMQRAAASPPASLQSTQGQNLPASRLKKKHSSADFDQSSLADHHAVQVALAAEEAKRQIAIEKQAADAGDTRWVLDFSQEMNKPKSQTKVTLRVIETGFAAIDNAVLPGDDSSVQDKEPSSDRSKMDGRRSFGKFNRMLEKSQDEKAEGSDSSSDDDAQSEDEGEESGGHDPSGTNELLQAVRQEAAQKLKAERRAKRKAEKAESIRLAEKRKKKDVKLNQLTSISGAGKDNKTCFQCGKEGHIKANCPEGVRDRVGDQDRPRKKSRKSK